MKKRGRPSNNSTPEFPGGLTTPKAVLEYWLSRVDDIGELIIIGKRKGDRGPRFVQFSACDVHNPVELLHWATPVVERGYVTTPKQHQIVNAQPEVAEYNSETALDG